MNDKLSELRKRLMDWWQAHEASKASSNGDSGDAPDGSADAYILYLENRIHEAEQIIGVEFSKWYGKMLQNKTT